MNRIASLLIATLLATGGTTVQAEITENATEAVKHMGLGWNLGNTLDANGRQVTGDPSNPAYWGCQGLESETYWGQGETTAALMTMMKEAGFGAIRVPVTWYNHMDKDGQVDKAWMKRVRAVVDYVVSNGLYCVLNVHHDTGADSNGFASWIKADEANFATNQTRYEGLWRQIAEEFKDYDHHLLFEAYNEMLDVKSSWCFASFACPGQYDAKVAASAYKGLNSYAQSFVSTVRATGGNNATRNLVVNTYAAANGGGTWNAHLKDPLRELTLPQDEAKGHLIAEVHSYPSINNNGKDRPLADIQKEVNTMFADLKTYLTQQKGVPVIIGEWGTSGVDSGAGKTDYDVRRPLMFQFVDHFIQQAKANDMATFFWMGLTDGLYRTLPAFSQPDLAERMAKAYHGNGFAGTYPVPQKESQHTCFEGDKALGWGNGITIPAALFDSFDADVQLVLTYSHTGSGDDIQLFLGDWSAKPSFIVDGQTFGGDLNPSKYYNTPTGTEHETVITFDATTFKLVQKAGLIIHGSNIRLTKAVLRDPSAAGIDHVKREATDDTLYDLTGRRIAQPVKGQPYILNGRRCIVR